MTAQRERFARLIAQGVSNSEACRLVGVNRRTGSRWRYGRSVPVDAERVRTYAPVLAPRPRPASSRYLSEEERILIADLHRAGGTCAEIAAELGRATSTVSRELARNRDEYGRYGGLGAHRLAVGRRARPRARRVESDPVLGAFVIGRLNKRWSPEQISRALSEEFGGDPSRQLVTESIYQAIYDPAGSLGAVCAGQLRTKRGRRRPHRRGDARRPGGLAQPALSITDRPAHVEDRLEVGHWEGYSIMGIANRSAIVTLIERVTRKVVLVHVGHDRSAAAVATGLIGVFSAMPPSMRRTLTWDQGKEMSQHRQLSTTVGIDVYFCLPASPWQRGSNENANGLLRDYFPKSTDLRAHTAAELVAAADELNDRPRKTLGWQTPDALYDRALRAMGASPATAVG